MRRILKAAHEGTVPAIAIEGLTKDFFAGFWKTRPVRAVDNLNLSVEKGEVFGFLGPNGAGKTTTLKMLMNLLHPTSGRAWILDEPVDSVSMHRRIGFLPENPYFYDYLTAGELLAYMARLFGISRQVVHRKVGELLEKVGLTGAADTQLRKFSKGMIQRIGIAQALVNDPDVVFLDEPMSGLDPLGRREVRQVVSALKSGGVTVFFSSHILPDVETLCDRVGIMNRGRLQAAGHLNEILKMRIEGHEVILAGADRAIAAGLSSMSDQMTAHGDRLCLRAATSAQVESIVKCALANGAVLISVNPIRPSLEDYFFREISSARGGGTDVGKTRA
jgi:ABC-2 type transport system ATP-binding protein